MKALILRKDANAAAGCAQALIDKGFQVACVETRRVAHALIRLEVTDLLVMDEQIDGRLTHALALSAERRNPYISTILVTDRPGPDTDELYDLIPSLYGLVGSGSSARLISQLALASTENFDEAQARVQRQAQLIAEGAIWPEQDDAVVDETIPDFDVYPDRYAEQGVATDHLALHPQEQEDHTDSPDSEDFHDRAFENAEQDVLAEPETAPPYIAFDEAQFAALTSSHSYTLLGPKFMPDDAMSRIPATC